MVGADLLNEKPSINVYHLQSEIWEQGGGRAFRYELHKCGDHKSIFKLFIKVNSLNKLNIKEEKKKYIKLFL